jgi:hypothetical protein
MIRYLVVIFLIPVFTMAQEISGVPSQITGVNRTEGESINDMSGGAGAATRYVKERIGNLSFTKPATDARDPSDSPQVTSQPETPSALSDPQSELVVQLSAPRGPIEYDIPENMKLVSLNGNGKGVINGSNSGTYVVRAPALYFSLFTLPFQPKAKTPFPEFSEIVIEDGVVMIAPKTVAPVNVVLYHPDKPSLSVSLVVIPDSTTAPADVRVNFNKNSIPESKRQENKNGVVVDGHRIARIRKKNSATVSEYERGNAHTEILKKINVDLAKGFLPDGYELNVISEGPSGVLCGDKRLVGTYVQNMIGEQFEVDVFNIKNAGKEYVTFVEENCYRSGVSSVQFNPSSILRPGSSAELIIIHTKTPDDISDKVRRPSVARGID